MRALVFLILAFASQAALALEFKSVTHEGKRYTVCRIDLRADKLHLFLRDNAGQYFKSFENIDQALAPRGQRLVFGMNAGMYHPGLIPVGLFVTGGTQLAPLNLENGEGNFFMKPNGVFLLTASGARVLESSLVPTVSEKIELATQSGPLLVIGGKIHPKFNPQSTSELFRNGVGVTAQNEVYFAISEEPVNFYNCATLFRDALKCSDALFFDGTVSSLHSTELKRSDKKIDLGPIIGVLGPIPQPQP
jgi:uncharacterized protein YigE (DUF2233 family)